MSTRLAPLALLCLVLLAFAGCSDSSEPAVSSGDGTGAVDPGAGTFVLKSLQCPIPGGGFCAVELIGTDLTLDDDGEHVDLTVAVRNAGREALHAPLTVWVSDFEPSSTWPVNGDVPIMAAAPAPGIAGYIYEEELGEDRVLDPGEVSGGRLWRFRTEDQAPFSFAMRMDAGEPPLMAAISGHCFWDENRNGEYDDGEMPVLGFLKVTAPDSTHTTLVTDRSGYYSYALHTTGLHVIHCNPGIDTLHKGDDDFAPIAFSTPNPLHVLITPDADGNPRGFHGANFGIYTDLPQLLPPIRFTETPVDSLHQEPWDLLEVGVTEDDRMGFEVGYSGCNQWHHFGLWMSGGFMESNPVQVDIVLVHYTAEACDAAFTGEYLFDLLPLAEEFRHLYGPGTLLLNVHDFAGDVQRIEWEIEDEIIPD